MLPLKKLFSKCMQEWQKLEAVFFFSPSLDHLVSSCITVIVNANAVLIYGWKLELKDGKADISDLVHSSSRSGEKMEDAVTCLAAHKHQKHLAIQI